MRATLMVTLVALTLISCNRTIEPQRSSSQPATAPVITANGQQSFAELVDRVAPAVVTIRSERRVRAPQQFPFFNDPMLREFFGLGRGGREMPRDQIQRGLGSGVVVSEDGYIMTNHHVIDGAQDITVEFAEGKTQKASLVGSDPPSDLAVLKSEWRQSTRCFRSGIRTRCASATSFLRWATRWGSDRRLRRVLSAQRAGAQD